MKHKRIPWEQRRWSIAAAALAGAVAALAAATTVDRRAHGALAILACYAALFTLTVAVLLAIRRMRTLDLLAHRAALANGTSAPTILEFTSSEFPQLNEEPELDQGRYGASLAAFLAETLPTQGWFVEGVDHDDFAHWIELGSGDRFAILIGCTSDPDRDGGFRILLHPPAPYVRVWLRRVSTTETMQVLGEAVRAVLEGSGKAKQLRWLRGAEELALLHGAGRGSGVPALQEPRGAG